MNLEEIKAAVDAGQNVYWRNMSWRVVKQDIGYMIKYTGGTETGLTVIDGHRLHGKPTDFFTVGDPK